MLKDDHMHELEALVMRIASPAGTSKKADLSVQRI
jgi:hypothetical protein